MIPRMSFMAANNAENVAPVEKKNNIQIPDVPTTLEGLGSLLQFFTTKTEEPLQTAFESVDLNKEVAPAIRKYKDLGFNKQQISFLLNKRPQSLVLSADTSRFDINTFTDYLTQKYKIPALQIRAIILRNPNFFRISQTQLENNIKLLTDSYKWNQVTPKHII